MTSNIQKKIKHVVVLMMENRSFDNLVGWLYEDGNQPKHFLPKDTPDHLKSYNGLSGTDFSNPLNLSDPSTTVNISKGVPNHRVPNPDPNEAFKHMNQQLFGKEIDKNTKGWLPTKEKEYRTPNMQGFLADYVTAKCSNASIAPQIMQTYTPEILNVMSGLAKKYAVSDNYHASCPTQTWPNRAFMHAGTSQSHVNNAPNLPYTCKTIFNVLEEEKVSWKVYKSSEILPSLTRIQMVQLWDPLLYDHFHHVSKFIEDCENGELPAYSFIEPSFVIEEGANATSEHPPANVCAGDHFLQKICNAIIGSKSFKDTLLIINFDEHGGCPDHVPPNWTAVPPDKECDLERSLGFRFNRYGVRVPAIFVSPYISECTLIRATTDPWSKESVPYDHTSILAMLLDWQGIDRAKLPSERVKCAPLNPFDELLEGELRQDRPNFQAQCAVKKESCWHRLINFLRGLFGLCAEGNVTSLQQSIIVADAHYRAAKQQNFAAGARESQEVIDLLLANIKTEADMVKHFKSLNMGDK